MAVAVPFLTLEWMSFNYIIMNWTHDGVDIFGWYIEVYNHDTSELLANVQKNIPSLRTYQYPQYTDSYELQENTTYRLKVTALSALGNVPSRFGTIRKGTRASHTFFDGTVFTFPSSDASWANCGTPNDPVYLPVMEFTHLMHGQVPSNFLPWNAIPLYVTGGITFGSFTTDPAIDASVYNNESWPTLFVRPSGWTPNWDASPVYPNANQGGHADAEWLDTTRNIYNTLDPIMTAHNPPGGNSELNPITGVKWTRTEIMSYWWGWAWYSWYQWYHHDDTVTVPDGEGIKVVPHRMVIDEGRISMMKAHVDYSFPPLYEGESIPTPPATPGIYFVSPNSELKHDRYYSSEGSIDKKIPNPTVRTGGIGE